MNQNEPLRAVVTFFAISCSRKLIRLVDDVTAASSEPVCMAAYVSSEVTELMIPPDAFSMRSISREPPRIFRPLVSSGLTMPPARDATPPPCQTQVRIFTPRLSSSDDSSCPIGAVFHASPWA